MKALRVQAILALLVVVGVCVNQVSTQCVIDPDDYAIELDPALGSGPCAGYLVDEEDSNPDRFCGDLDERAVERACWVAGAAGITHTVTGNKFRNYRCYQNKIDGEGHTGASAWVLDDALTNQGHYCLNGGDENCFVDCYGGVYDSTSNCPDDKDLAFSCTDRDECKDGVIEDCIHPFAEDCPKCKPCGPNTRCVNEVGSYSCECLDGFTAAAAADRYDVTKGCVPVDQCGEEDTCPSTAACLNTMESYLCFCQTVGYDWDHSTETCVIKDCGAPPSITYATAQDGSDQTYLSDHVYKCDDGYIPATPSGDIEIKCRGDLQWCHCAALECVKRPCGVPHMDPNACTVVGSWVYEGEITFECLDGFKAKGEEEYTIKCLATGMWETTSTSCKDVNECEDVDICEGSAECINTIGSYHCVCHPGYYGKDCEPISCGPLPVVPNADLTTSPVPAGSYYGLTLNYRCEDAYRVAHRFSPDLDEFDFDVVCNLDKRWNPDPIPECKPISCGDPGFIKYASRQGATFTYGSQVSYKCAEGYRPSDYDLQDDSTYTTFTITCGLDWLWTAKPSCVKIDECVEYDNPCGGDNQYCVDLVGSYMCSCDTSYRIDKTGKSCVGFPVTVEEISADPCEVYNTMRFCHSGYCKYDEEAKRPACVCNAGYKGAFCDREDTDLLRIEVMLGVIGCIIAGLALIFCVILACYICSRHHKKHKHKQYNTHVAPTEPPAVVYKSPPNFLSQVHPHGHRYAPSVWPLGSNHFPF